MKKIKEIFTLVAIFTFVFSGCVSSSEGKIESKAVNIEFNEEEALEEQNYWSVNYVNTLTKQNNNYYIMAMEKLKVLDGSTMELRYLCNDVECKHVDESDMILPTCGAYHERCTKIFNYQNKLYTYSMNEDGSATLKEIDGQSGEEKVLFDIVESKDNNYLNMVIGNNQVYVNDVVMDNTEEKEEDTATIEAFSLDSQQNETIFSYKNKYPNIMEMKLYGGNLFFVSTYKENEGNYPSQIWYYDTTTKESQSVVSGNNITDYVIDEETKTLFLYQQDVGLYKVDLATGKNILLKKSDNEISTAVLSIDRDYIYMDNNVYEGNHELIICDHEGNVKNMIPCDESQIYFGDEKFLFSQNKNPEINWQYIDKKEIGKVKEWKQVKIN